MKKTLFRCMCLVALIFATSSFQPQKTNKVIVVSNLIIPFDQIFPGASETVSFSGQLHLVSIFIPNDPVRIHTNVINMEGKGQSSGLIYKVVGSNNFTAVVSAGSQFQIDQIYQLFPTDPILPPSPIRFRYTIDLDVDGFATNATAEIVIVEGLTN